MDNTLLRYSCQVNLPGFNIHTQQKLKASRVLIVGAGGLGCPAAQYLAAAGTGNLTIADDDVISISNLHRQTLYTPSEAGYKKATIAAQKLQLQNPEIIVTALNKRITSENALDIITPFDVLVDCTDNFETRYLLNDACVLLHKPVVYGAIYQYEGQVAVWNLPHAEGGYTPNYRDVFPAVNSTQVPDCAEGGVLPTIAGMIGCMQANEVIKYITGIGELLAGKIWMLDAQTLQSRTIKIGGHTTTNIRELAESKQIPEIGVAALREKISAGNCTLVDVRTTKERDNFNIGGTHIPLDQLQISLPGIPQDKPVIFYCASGKRSTEAAKMFMEKYPSVPVYSLAGGIKNWPVNLRL